MGNRPGWCRIDNRGRSTKRTRTLRSLLLSRFVVSTCPFCFRRKCVEEVSNQSLDQLDPSSDDLLRIVFSNVDESMLREIAAADYGQDFDEHLEQLAAIKSGKILAPMQWEPKEVLELIRWSEPEDPSWSPGSTGDRGHWIRLFACAALLRAASEPANQGYFTGEDSTIIQLVESAMKLGDKTSHAALKFLCWCMQTRPPEETERPYFAIGTLILLVRLDKLDPGIFEVLEPATKPSGLYPSRLFEDCQTSKTWHRLVSEVLIESNHSNQAVRDFAGSLLQDSDADAGA